MARVNKSDKRKKRKKEQAKRLAALNALLKGTIPSTPKAKSKSKSKPKSKTTIKARATIKPKSKPKRVSKNISRKKRLDHSVEEDFDSTSWISEGRDDYLREDEESEEGFVRRKTLFTMNDNDDDDESEDISEDLADQFGEEFDELYPDLEEDQLPAPFDWRENPNDMLKRSAMIIGIGALSYGVYSYRSNIMTSIKSLLG